MAKRGAPGPCSECHEGGYYCLACQAYRCWQHHSAPLAAHRALVPVGRLPRRS